MSALPIGTFIVDDKGQTDSLISGQMINTSHKRGWMTIMLSLSLAMEIVLERKTKMTETEGGSERGMGRKRGEGCVLGEGLHQASIISD